MAKIGVKGPWIATYNNADGNISYTDGIKLARQTQFEAKPNGSKEDNDFYSDNEMSETERGGSKSGTITESVDDFSQEGSKRVLGVREEDIEVGGKSYKELIYDDAAEPTYFGHGIIIKKRKDRKTKYRAVIYTKVMFDVPDDTATTQGKIIEWQAEEITATYMQDDSGTGRWKRESTFDTEAEAIAYVEKVLEFTQTNEEERP